MQKILQNDDIQVVSKGVKLQASMSLRTENHKNKFDRVIEYCENFEAKSTLLQAKNTRDMRIKLKRDLSNLKAFNEKNKYIDLKIEYD